MFEEKTKNEINNENASDTLKRFRDKMQKKAQAQDLTKEVGESGIDKKDATNEDNLEKVIKNAFAIALGREPTPNEIDKYKEEFNKGTITTSSQLKHIIANSPVPSKVVELSENDKLTLDDYMQYKTIIQIYNNILDRNPTFEELQYYFNLKQNDNRFDESKLEEVLLASKEYKILEQNQRNLVHGDLLGNITEQQLRYIIETHYNNVYSKKHPDKVVYAYLRSKLVEFNLDEDIFVAFLKALHQTEESMATSSNKMLHDKIVLEETYNKPKTKASPQLDTARVRVFNDSAFGYDVTKQQTKEMVTNQQALEVIKKANKGNGNVVTESFADQHVTISKAKAPRRLEFYNWDSEEED